MGEKVMKRKYFVSCCLIAVALVCMGQGSSCNAPLDATGSYSGKWSFKDNATTVDNNTAADNAADNTTAVKIIDCPLTMMLNQDVTLAPPENLNVAGRVHIDFSCLEEASTWPSWAQAPAPSDVTVTGLMSTDGKLTLASGGCGPGTCVILGLDGKAESNKIVEGKKVMTRYSGNWGFAVGIAFLGNLGATGTFEVTRDDE